MRRLFSALALGFTLVALPAVAQEPTPQAPAEAPAPGPATLDALVDDLYAAVSGEAGPRDWVRFRSLFYPNATLIPAGRRRDGSTGARIISPDGYIADNGPHFEQNGFFEREIGRSALLEYGPIVQFQSAYEARRAPSDAEPFMRGINSIVAFNDGKRWWVLSIAWSAETPETPLPADMIQSAAATAP